MMGLPNCSEVARRLSRECDNPKHRTRPLGVSLHLLICGTCRRYRAYLRWLEHNLPRALDSAADARLSPEQRARIRQALRRRDNR